MSGIAYTPDPPYYAVIFTSKLKNEVPGYEKAALLMLEKVKSMPGYLGVETFHDEDGYGITVSYWEKEEHILSWKKNKLHLSIQEQGKINWYEKYQVRVCKVERAYGKD